MLNKKIISRLTALGLILMLMIALIPLTSSAASVNSAPVSASETDPFNDLRMYQVMVSAFQSGRPELGYNVGWGPASGSNPTRNDGDLYGIINALDYIKSTGCNALWMTPVFDNTGSSQTAKTVSTGYFCTDYFNVDPKFGGNEALKELIEKAHEKGLYVILDGVFGHHGGNVKASPSGLKPSGSSNPVSYPDSLPFYKEVATYWINEYKIDGWRLDQSYQVPLSAWKEIREAVESASAENKSKGETWGTLGYMVAEDWSSDSNISNRTFGTANNMGLKSAFDFNTRYRIVQTLAQEESGGSNSGTASSLNSRLNELTRAFPEHAQPNLFLTNHDVLRFGDLIRWKYGYATENPDYWKRHKAALSFLAQYTGPITLYYGDEIGDCVPGYNKNGDLGAYNDNVARTNGRITDFNTNETDLFNYVQNIMQIRAENPALSNGTRTNLIANNSIFADYKVFNENRVVYIVNTSTSQQTATFSANQIGGYTNIKNLETNAMISASGGNYSISVPALSALFLQMSPAEEPSTTVEITTTIESTTIESTTIEPTTIEPTTIEPTTIEPTTITVPETTTSAPVSTTLLTTTQLITTAPIITTLTFETSTAYEEITTTELITTVPALETFLLGDANTNDTVNITDATTILNYLVKLSDLSEKELKAADVTQDKSVNIKDVTELLRWLVQLPANQNINTIISYE